MQIEILNTRSVADLQKDFSTVFPFLKLEILKPKHTRDTNSSPFYSADRLLENCRKTGREGFLIINKNASILTFQQCMLNDYGLNVEVFRKCGNSWIATTLSRSWSLERQNNEGLETTSFDYPED